MQSGRKLARQRVLQALQEAKLFGAGWLRTDRLMATSHAHKAQARVVELRGEGWVIDCEPDPDGSGLGRYRLAGRTQPKATKVAGAKVWIYEDGTVEVTPSSGGTDRALARRLADAVEAAVRSVVDDGANEARGYSGEEVDLFDFLDFAGGAR